MPTKLVTVDKDTTNIRINKKLIDNLTYQTLEKNRSFLRFSSIEDAKLFLALIDKDEGWMKISHDSGFPKYSYSFVACCPFSIAVNEVNCCSGEKRIKMGYFISDYVPHNHTSEWISNHLSLDLSTRRGRIGLKLEQARITIPSSQHFCEFIFVFRK